MPKLLVTGPNGTRFEYDCATIEDKDSVLGNYRESNPVIDMPGSTIEFINGTESTRVRLPQEEVQQEPGRQEQI